MIRPVIVGNIGFDTIRIGKKAKRRELGGSALRIATALSWYRIPSILISVIGKEKIWNLILHQLEKLGVDNKLVKNNRKTVQFFIDYSDNFSLKRILALNQSMEKELERIITDNNYFVKKQWLHLCPLVLSTQINLIKLFKKMNPNGFVSLQVHESEMASKSIKELTKIMKLIDMIFLNEFEFNKIEEKVSNLKGYLFLTRGNKGVEVFFHNKKIGSICSPNVEVVDVTGAGDAFAGGVLATYLRFKNKTDGEDLLNLMLKEGTLLAGYTLSDYGFDNIFKLLKIKKKL